MIGRDSSAHFVVVTFKRANQSLQWSYKLFDSLSYNDQVATRHKKVDPIVKHLNDMGQEDTMYTEQKQDVA